MSKEAKAKITPQLEEKHQTPFGEGILVLARAAQVAHDQGDTQAVERIGNLVLKFTQVEGFSSQSKSV